MGKSITQSKIEANELTTVWLLVLALLGRAKTVLRNNKTTRKKTDGKKEERESMARYPILEVRGPYE